MPNDAIRFAQLVSRLQFNRAKPAGSRHQVQRARHLNRNCCAATISAAEHDALRPARTGLDDVTFKVWRHRQRGSDAAAVAV